MTDSEHCFLEQYFCDRHSTVSLVKCPFLFLLFATGSQAFTTASYNYRFEKKAGVKGKIWGPVYHYCLVQLFLSWLIVWFKYIVIPAGLASESNCRIRLTLKSCCLVRN